jgi:purine-cytosine permease-like protein
MSTPGIGQRTTTRRVGAWIVLLLAMVATATIVGVVDWFVVWGQSSTCGDAPDPSQVRTGQAWLAGVLLVSATPWAVAAVTSRDRLAVLVTGTIAVLPGLLFFLAGLSTDTWVGSFCF